MDLSRTLYLLLALLGLVFPVRRFAQWFDSHGVDLALLTETLMGNLLTRGITDALIIVSTACIVFMVGECWLRRDRLSTIAIPTTLLLGPAVGLPLYLFLRLRRIG